MLRVRNSTHNLLFSETTTISDWNFEQPYHHELYDLSKDPHQLDNVLDRTPADAPPQVFHTGELRAVRIFAEEAPRAPRVCEFQSHAMFGATWSSQPPPSKATAESPCYVHCTIDPLSRGHAVGGADAPTSTLPLGCELEVAMEATPLTRERM